MEAGGTPKNTVELDGKMLGILVEQRQYPANLDNVAAVSDRQIFFLRRDRHELSHFHYEFFDMDDAKSITYREETAYYRIVTAIACFLIATFFAVMLAMQGGRMTQETQPFLIGIIAFVSFGVRFVTSTHRHIVTFEAGRNHPLALETDRLQAPFGCRSRNRRLCEKAQPLSR